MNVIHLKLVKLVVMHLKLVKLVVMHLNGFVVSFLPKSCNSSLSIIGNGSNGLHTKQVIVI